MKKEKSKDPQEAREVTVWYEKGKMIFQTGESIFFLSEETAGKIFGRSVGLEFERLRGEDETFGGLKSLENYVKIQRLLRKGMGMDGIAKVLGCTQEKLRQFYGTERARPHVESWGPNEIENERKRQSDLEMDFCKEARRDRALNEVEPPEPGEKFVDLLQLRNLQKAGKTEGQIAEHLNLDKKEFSKFMEKNQRYLDLMP